MTKDQQIIKMYRALINDIMHDICTARLVLRDFHREIDKWDNGVRLSVDRTVERLIEGVRHKIDRGDAMLNELSVPSSSIPDALLPPRMRKTA